MRRLVVVLSLVAAVVLIVGTGLAVASFTTHRSNHQEFTAADSFRPKDRLEALSKTNNGGAAANQVPFGLRLRNIGDTRVDLNSVTMRYWFTADGATSEPVPFCFYAPIGCTNVKLGVDQLHTALEGADHFFEVDFKVGSGRLDPGQSADLSQLAFGHPAGGTFDQQDDWSFLNAGSFASNAHVTVYVGNDLVWGVEPKPVPLHEGVEVLYANRDPDPHSSAIMFTLDVQGTGTLDVDLSELTLRYWFTRDGAGHDQLLAFCDYAQIGCNKINNELTFHPVSPARPGADSYLQIGFDRGTLEVGDSTGQIQLRMHRYDYAPMDETNDFSRGTDTALKPWPKVTAYLRGELVWGTEP